MLDLSQSGLNAIRRRNEEIVKTYYTMNGYLNMKAEYVIRGSGYAKELRERMLPEESTSLGRIVNHTQRRSNYIVSHFIYAEDLSDYFFTLIIDEKLIKRDLSISDLKIIQDLLANFRIVAHLISQEQSEDFDEKMSSWFDRNLDVIITGRERDDLLSVNSSRMFRIQPGIDQI